MAVSCCVWLSVVAVCLLLVVLLFVVAVAAAVAAVVVRDAYLAINEHRQLQPATSKKVMFF